MVGIILCALDYVHGGYNIIYNIISHVLLFGKA